MSRTLPRWNASMSDGCTLIGDESNPKYKACCLKHDEAYYYGGTEMDRQAADQQLYECLQQAGMSKVQAYIWWMGVRAGGGPVWNQARRSWANGGDHFQYSEKATPTE